MNKPPTAFGFWLSVFAVASTAVVLELIRAKRTGHFELFMSVVLGTALVIVPLLEWDRFLGKRKSQEWMTRFHICIGVALVAALTILTVYVITKYG